MGKVWVGLGKVKIFKKEHKKASCINLQEAQGTLILSLYEQFWHIELDISSFGLDANISTF